MFLFFSNAGIAQQSAPLRLIKSPDENDGVSVFKSNEETESSLETKGMVKLDAPLSLVFAVVADHENLTKWMPNITKATMQKKQDGYVMSNIIEHALLIDDREVTTWTTINCEPIAKNATDGPKQIRIKFTANNENIPPFVKRTKKRALIHGLVRVPQMEGYWVLAPGNNANETRVVLQAKMDLAGALTASMKEIAIEEFASKTLKNLRERVNYQKDKITSTDYQKLKENIPQVFQVGCVEAK